MFRTLILGLFFALLHVTWTAPAAMAQEGLWGKFSAAGRQALGKRDFPSAEKQFAAALKEAERHGPETARVATTLFSQAELLGAQGKYAAAEPLVRRVLTIRKKVLPPDHPDLALGLAAMGSMHLRRHEFAVAEPLATRALAILEKVVAADDPRLAAALNVVGMLYTMQRRLAEAEPFAIRAFTIRQDALAADHPDVA
ncbi:MAG: tetratricopeptide repeat protein [Alphaproteobacteria bacterium]|nr:tetratricopeptide repeat protein [Alphaproteobacteria bacterium]